MQNFSKAEKPHKLLLVANVAKEHVLKFHVPTIKHLTEAGWQVDVACSGKDTVPYCNTQFEMSYKRSPFNLALFKGIRELKKVIDGGDYDIVYCHTPVGSLAARIAARKARKKGTKVVYMAHGLHFFKGAPIINWLIYYPIEFVLSFFTDSMILINREDYELAKSRFHHKQTYLINGIGTDIDKFKISDGQSVRLEYRSQMNIPESSTVLVYLAELIPNKNQKLLMNVLKRLLSGGVEAHLVLPGIDHTDGEFEKYAKDIGVYENVRFLGWRSDVANIYAASDICTSSSIREGFGINIVEAMAASLPVIATENRGHSTIIKDGENGFLVPLGDEQVFEDRIKSIINDNGLRQSIIEQSQKDIDKYSIPVAVESIYGILKEQL